MAGERCEATEAAIEASLRHRLVHAGQHRLKISARWREPTGLVRATEIAQITVLDAPSDGPTLRQAEAFPLQAASSSLSYPASKPSSAASACRRPKIRYSRSRFSMSDGPVADERRARWIEIALQARDPRASLPIDEGAEVVADLSAVCMAGSSRTRRLSALSPQPSVRALAGSEVPRLRATVMDFPLTGAPEGRVRSSQRNRLRHQYTAPRRNTLEQIVNGLPLWTSACNSSAYNRHGRRSAESQLQSDQ